MKTDIKLVDTTFGINPQAKAVLHYLSARDCNDIAPGFNLANHQVATRLMHNGREEGVALVCQKYGQNNPTAYRVIWWAEHRNSDGIFVDWFDTPELSDSFNMVPTSRDFPDDGSKYDHETETHGRKCFGYAEIAPVVEFIESKVREFFV